MRSAFNRRSKDTSNRLVGFRARHGHAPTDPGRETVGAWLAVPQTQRNNLMEFYWITKSPFLIYFLSCQNSRSSSRFKINAENEELSTVNSRSGGARWAVVIVTHEDERSLAVG